MPALDVACVFAAACDLAMADAAFRASVSASGTGLADSLTTILQKAARYFPRDPETQGLVTLMDCQLTRAEAAGLRVRVSTPVICVSCILHDATLGVLHSAQDRRLRSACPCCGTSLHKIICMFRWYTVAHMQLSQVACDLAGAGQCHTSTL